MKYGETLRQRSIPEWATYNVDYDEIKELIKQRTSPGVGKAVSIPGKDDKAAKEFENEMFSILRDQHDRIDLFVRSKSGEIKRRLDHLKKQLPQLRARTPPGGQHANPGKLLERYSRIEEACLKAGEEVRSLSRFIGAQRLAFQKLLKKYKKWTASSELGARFQKEIARKPDSFSNINLKPLLNEWTEVLHAVRTQFKNNVTGLGQRSGKETSEKRQSVPGLTASSNVDNLEAADPESNLEFDARVSALRRATYWVHQDNIVELQVLLMSYMRLRSRGERSVSENGLIILDDPEHFAQRNNSRTAEEADESAPRAAGTLRWVDRSDVVALLKESRKDSRECSISTCFKPKRLGDVLCTDRHVAKGSSTTSTENSSAAQPLPQDGGEKVRSWLIQHPNVKPLVCISSNRTRFLGPNLREPDGLWAALDNEIHMKKPSLDTIAGKDFIFHCRDKALQFPHAVLQLGTEGNAAHKLIRVLDSSHLRVRGFSLVVHAVALCCKPEKLRTPFWIPALDQDIRRVPERSRLRSARAPSLPTTSDSVTPSVTADPAAASTRPAQNPAPVMSLANELESAPVSAFGRKRRRTRLRDSLTTDDDRGEPSQRYWNEYDESEYPPGDDYVIYVDPGEPSGLPGAHFWRKLRRSLIPHSKVARSEDDIRAPFADERTSLLDRSEAPTGDDSVDNDDATSSIGELPPQLRAGTRYGTVNPGKRLRQHFSANESANDMISILSETRRRRDSGKLRLYVTCFISSLALDGMVTLVEATGRKKQRDTIDVGATVGVALSLIFALVALCTFLSRRSSAGWLHMVAVLAVFAVICTTNGALLAWVIN